jgi:hypothetical protein
MSKMMANSIDGWTDTRLKGVSILFAGNKPVRVSVTEDDCVGFSAEEIAAELAHWGAKIEDPQSWSQASGEPDSTCPLAAI